MVLWCCGAMVLCPDSNVDATREVIEQKRLVGATCLGLRDIGGRHFDCVILDEAGQLTEPVALGPLLLGGSFIMVGDHFQLPPLVISEQAKRGGMDISLFKRLAEAHPDAVTWLDTQYRMNDDVMAIANTLEYERRKQ